jgi:hypothetical protein
VYFKELMVMRHCSMCGNIYKKCTPPHLLKTTYRIPGIPCYLRHHGQNFTPLNFGTDPISVQGWQVHVYTPKCMFIPPSACLYPQVHDFLIQCSYLFFCDFLLILGQILQVIAWWKAIDDALLVSHYPFSICSVEFLVVDQSMLNRRRRKERRVKKREKGEAANQ